MNFVDFDFSAKSYRFHIIVNVFIYFISLSRHWIVGVLLHFSLFGIAVGCCYSLFIDFDITLCSCLSRRRCDIHVSCIDFNNEMAFGQVSKLTFCKHEFMIVKKKLSWWPCIERLIFLALNEQSHWPENERKNRYTKPQRKIVFALFFPVDNILCFQFFFPIVFFPRFSIFILCSKTHDRFELAARQKKNRFIKPVSNQKKIKWKCFGRLQNFFFAAFLMSLIENRQ